MLDLFVGFMQYALWIALVLYLFILFALRIVYVLTYNIPIKDALKVLLLPLSIGYFLSNMKIQDKRILLYEIVVISSFIFMVFASIFVFYCHFA